MNQVKIGVYLPNKKVSYCRAIKVIFKDGSNGVFPYVWLRDCSLDEDTYVISNAMKGRLHLMRDFDVKFTQKKKNLYEQQWLRDHCPGSNNVREKRRKIYLGRECIYLWEDRAEIEYRLKRFSHQSFLEDDKVRRGEINWFGIGWIRSGFGGFFIILLHGGKSGLPKKQVLHDFLTAVCIDGIAVLKGKEYNKKLRNDVLWSIINRIGMVQPTHFGETFGVWPKPDASNMAYANTQELPYHTDFPSLQDPPQLQMLHMCKMAECGGGKSMFVDGFSVAKKVWENLMSIEHPDHFQLLCSIPLEFIEEGFDVHNVKGFENKEERVDFSMVARHKTFKTNDLGRVIQVQFGNVMRSWFVDTDDPLIIQKVYDALKLFTTLCYLPENQLIFPLESGKNGQITSKRSTLSDTVLWANTRLLHARSSYKLIGIPERERYMLGCYFGWDTIKSRIRLIRRQLKLPEEQEML
ncbi:hypothetical protein Mgra_00006036 [Meloidogyne graminicola]|uniref:TauD/TfdA-like domain-containing protein n=1 Tax=Meloidogyne graminicola TaxID=189291 RepID=A0A8S9ZM95_9BILA|nr:hypothetical protein Mgra_00006036 [Meloidogyne graminicola]